MTQIKLRRDTSANFTSKNPVLGAGEPAYETDTKKLKIGDGTTAYNSLDYFTSGGGSSTNITAALPLKIVDGVISLEVDGQTIQIVDGKLHANLDELGNEVNDLSSRVTAAEADILKKQDKLTAGDNITISVDNIISAAASSGLEVKTATTADFNSSELLETGLYYISGGLSPQNGPVGYSVASMLITMKWFSEISNQRIQQTWIGCEDLVGNQIYTRYSSSNGKMGSWTRVDSNKIASASALGSIKVGDGLTISSDGTLSASSSGGGDVSTSANNIFTGENTFSNLVKANNIQTTDGDRLIEYESGTLQIGNNDSIQSIAIRADGPITDATGNAFVTEDMVATTSSTGLVKVDGTTITVDNEGKISASGGSSSGDVSSSGNNTFTGINSFKTPIILDATGSTCPEIQVRYTNDAGSITTGSLITPDNFSLGETYATLNIGVSKIRTNFFGKSFNMENSLAVNGAITISNTGGGQVNKLRLAALNGSATTTTLYNGLQIYTDIDTYTSTLRVGDIDLPLVIQGSTIKDNNNAEFVRLVESHTDETGGYRLYSDGYCEQWGDSTGVATTSITFLKPYKNTSYTVLATSGYPNDNPVYNSFLPHEKTPTGFSVKWVDTLRYNMWRAFGYV